MSIFTIHYSLTQQNIKIDLVFFHVWIEIVNDCVLYLRVSLLSKTRTEKLNGSKGVIWLCESEYYNVL